MFVTGVVAMRYLEKKNRRHFELGTSLWRKLDYDVRRALAVHLFMSVEADDKTVRSVLMNSAAVGRHAISILEEPSEGDLSQRGKPRGWVRRQCRLVLSSLLGDLFDDCE